MIDKQDQVRVGGVSGIDPISGLPMFRRFRSFEANRDQEFIRTWYDEYLQYPTGVNTVPMAKYYDVKNIIEVTAIIPAVGHTIAEVGHIDPNGNEYIIDTLESYVVDVAEHTVISVIGSNGFDNWYNYSLIAQMAGMHIGRDIIVGAINATLAIIPFDAPNGYVHL